VYGEEGKEMEGDEEEEESNTIIWCTITTLHVGRVTITENRLHFDLLHVHVLTGGIHLHVGAIPTVVTGIKETCKLL